MGKFLRTLAVAAAWIGLSAATNFTITEYRFSRGQTLEPGCRNLGTSSPGKVVQPNECFKILPGDYAKILPDANSATGFRLCISYDNNCATLEPNCLVGYEYLDQCFANGYQGAATSVKQNPPPNRPTLPPIVCPARCTGKNEDCNYCSPGLTCSDKQVGGGIGTYIDLYCTEAGGANELCAYGYEQKRGCIPGYSCVYAGEEGYRVPAFCLPDSSTLFNNKEGGQPCSANNQCQSNQCNNGVCGSIANGQSCTTTADCNSVTSFCSTDKVCKLRHQGAVGTACGMLEDCQEGLVCAESTCKTIGSPTYLKGCQSNADCTQANGEFCTCAADINQYSSVCFVEYIATGYTAARQELAACTVQHNCILPNGNTDQNCTWTFCKSSVCSINEIENAATVEAKVSNPVTDCNRRLSLIPRCRAELGTNTPSPTPSPITPSPVTPSPVTPSPVTPSPSTPSPSPVTPAPTGPAATCSAANHGQRQCESVGSAYYRTCNWNTWVRQPCASGLVCKPAGDNVYCVRPSEL